MSTDCSNNSTTSVPPTPRTEGEILQSPNLKSFNFSDLKVATRNFRPDSVLGGGGFGSVFKGWIDENSFTATKPGTGMVIAVKKLHQESFQGHREWLVSFQSIFFSFWFWHYVLLIVKWCICGECRQKWTIWGSFPIPISWSLLAIAWRMIIGFWFMSSCLVGAWRIISFEVSQSYNLDLFLWGIDWEILKWCCYVVGGSYFQPLSWNLRLKVALGAAKGVAFLHSSEAKVIYRDFKTSNILLDSVNYSSFSKALPLAFAEMAIVLMQSLMHRLQKKNLEKWL